jgi:predicted nucleotidyltransferase
MVSTKIIEIIKLYLNELSEKRIYISKCFLYGSHAKGSASESSDINIMLVSPLFDIGKEKYLPAIWLSNIRTNHRIEPLVIGEQRFLTDDISPIIEVVRQEGIEIAA